MKRYLTGMDWVVNTLDYTAKAQSGIGNHSAVILEFKKSPHPKALETLLNNFTQKFPLLNGYPSRAMNLCPYWKVPFGEKALPLRIKIIKLESHSLYLELLGAQVNTALQNIREHLVFTLIESKNNAFLSMTFDHRILDAKGAEDFLYLLQQHDEHKTTLQNFSSSPQLNNWKEKLLAGRQVNRFLLNFTKVPPRIIPFRSLNDPCKFKVVCLNAAQTEHFTNSAYTQAGYLMFLPYALAKSIQIMHQIFQEKNIPGSIYLIPVPIDRRAKEATQKETFFNHFSFFLFKIDAAKIDNLGELLTEIKQQMYTQVKNRLPEAIVNASFLLRIATLPIANFFLKLMSKKHFASFSFSYLNNAHQPDKLLEEKVENIFHLPRMPKPPGIGIFFNQFENKLNITLSYFDDLLNEAQANQVTASLEALGNEN